MSNGVVRITEFGDWDSVEQLIDEAGDTMRSAVAESAEWISMIMLGDAIANAPQSLPDPTKGTDKSKASSGMLKQSIESKVDETDAGITARISTNLDYAPYNEYGTGQRGAQSNLTFKDEDGNISFSSNWAGMVARPFMRPALYNNEAIFREELKANIRKALGL